MSETIMITIEDGQTRQKILHDKTRNILETFLKNGMAQGSFCKGLSLCGHCKIRFLKGAPLPGMEDRKYFDAALLREGYRLACRAKPKQDCTIELCFEKETDMQIVTSVKDMPKSQENGYRTEGSKKPSAPAEGTEYGRGQEDITAACKKHRRVFAAADIGTTTVVMQLADVLTGEVLATVKFMNPQRCYGLDVLSRIQAAKKYGKEMRKCMLQAVMQGVKDLLEDSRNLTIPPTASSVMRHSEPAGAPVVEPELLCITGNTAMLHIFMGYDTSGLGESPFTPVSVKEEELVIEGVKTLIMPSVSAFVGADVAAGILETGMQKSEKITLLIDLGTNGEMALGNRDKILACAAAAGPAFEGGAGQGIYGADILAAIAGLLDAGIMEESGYIDNPQTYTYQGKQIEITLEKVREIQLAKAAIRAGIEILIKKYGLSAYEQIDAVYLAGGFGFFLSDHAAVRTGLLPKELGNRTRAIGNSALAGAVSYGSNFCMGKAGEKECLLDTARIQSFNLAKEQEFQEVYIKYMDFPKTVY